MRKRENMSEHISRCYRCQAPNPAWGMTICAACRQVEALEKQTEAANSRAEREAEMYAEQSAANARRLEEQNLEAMRIAENNARLARAQAKENARLAAEGGVSYDDAYQYGYYYVETSSTEDDNIYCSLTLQGELVLRRSGMWSPYKMEHLVQAFDRGFNKRIEELDLQHPGREHIENSVYNAGYNFMSSFYASHSVEVAGKVWEFRTSEFETNFNRKLVLETGEVQYFYDMPFVDDELNQMYTAGVNDKYAELDENTPEKLEKRLSTEVVDVLANQARAAEEQRVAAENERIHQENQFFVHQKRIAERESEKNVRKIIAAAILLAIVGLVVGLWIAGHPVFSVLAGFVAGCGLLSGGLGALFEFVEG